MVDKAEKESDGHIDDAEVFALKEKLSILTQVLGSWSLPPQFDKEVISESVSIEMLGFEPRTFCCTVKNLQPLH